MALWGNNDNIDSVGTVSLNYDTLVVTGSGTSFGQTGSARENDVIRFGVRGPGVGVGTTPGETVNYDGTFFGDAIIVSIANTQQLTIASTAALSGAAIAGTAFYVSQLPKYTTWDSHYSLQPDLDGNGVNYDALVYGVSTQDAENSQDSGFTKSYSKEDAGWVGITTYMAQGELRVKRETLVAMSGIQTGDNGIAYFTPV